MSVALVTPDVIDPFTLFTYMYWSMGRGLPYETLFPADERALGGFDVPPPAHPFPLSCRRPAAVRLPLQVRHRDGEGGRIAGKGSA